MVTPLAMIFPPEGLARLFTETCPFCIRVVYLSLHRDTSRYFLSARSQSSGWVPRTGRCLAFNPGSLQLRVALGTRDVSVLDSGWNEANRLQVCLPVLRVRWLERKSRARTGVGAAVELLSSLHCPAVGRLLLQRFVCFWGRDLVTACQFELSHLLAGFPHLVACRASSPASNQPWRVPRMRARRPDATRPSLRHSGMCSRQGHAEGKVNMICFMLPTLRLK